MLNRFNPLNWLGNATPTETPAIVEPTNTAASKNPEESQVPIEFSLFTEKELDAMKRGAEMVRRDQRIVALSAALKDAKAKFTLADEKNNVVLNGKDREIEELRAALAVANQKIVESGVANEKSKTRLANEMFAQIDGRDRVRRAELMLGDKNVKIRHLEAQCSEMRESERAYNRNIEQFQAAVSALENASLEAVAVAGQQLAKEEDISQKLRDINAGLHTQLAIKDDEIASEYKKTQQAQDHLVEAQSELFKTKSDMLELKDQIERLMEDRDALRLELGELTDELNAAKAAVRNKPEMVDASTDTAGLHPTTNAFLSSVFGAPAVDETMTAGASRREKTEKRESAVSSKGKRSDHLAYGRMRQFQGQQQQTSAPLPRSHANPLAFGSK